MEIVYIDEREDVQKKTFAKWINSQLVKSNCSLVNDLFVDLQDGTRLLALLEILTGKQYKREKGRMRVHHLNNVNRALQVLEHNNVKLVNISSNDIVDGNPKLILGLVWSIILHWQVHYHLKDLMSELQQTNLEKTLLAWCRQNTQNYSGVDVRNFTTSWSDGLAFNALLHNFRPDLFDFANVTRRHPNARLDHAFRVAQEQFAIERLLDPEDVNTSVPDKKSIMMYVMCLFQSLPHSSLEVSTLEFLQSDSSSSLASPATTFEGGAGEPEPRSSRPHSLATNASVELGGYQVAMEEVLTWLLEAEDRLSQDLALGSSDLETIKEYFHSHEGFLLELSGHQEGVGAVLEEGARMLSEGGLTRDEEDEVRVQMRLLNSRWEALRLKAMEKQASIHTLLMSAQQKQLDSLREWLTATEDRISRMSRLGPDLRDLQAQQQALAILRDDLQLQQKTVDSLCNLVIVVDDNAADNTYSAMEDQLAALGERWEHICQWSEERWGLLHQLTTSANQLMDQVSWLQQWLLSKETILKQMEAEPATEMGAILDRIKQLQVMRQQLDAQQKRLTGIQEAASELNLRMRPPEGGRDLEQIEALQDRWDALVEILEMQSQRISSSGFEVTPAVGDSSATISSSLAWEETSPSEDGQGSWKRRKVEGGQTELDKAMGEMQGWLRETEQQLRSHSDGEGLRRLRGEWLQRRHTLDHISRLAQACIQEIITDGGSPEEEEKRLSEITKIYENMDLTLQQKTEEVEQRTLLENEMANVIGLVEEYNQWLSTTDSQDVDVCSAKIKSLKSQEDRLTILIEKTRSFYSHHPDSDESKAVQEKVESLAADTDTLYNRLLSLQKELSEPSPQAKYTEAKTKLTKWMDDVEGILLSEHVVLTYPHSMEEQLVKFQELEKNISAQQEGYDLVKAAGEELMQKAPNERLKEELQDLHTRWADIPRILIERRTKLQTDIGKIQQLKDEVQNVEVWLQQAEGFLAHENIATVPLSALHLHLQRTQDLLDEATNIDVSIQNIKKGGEELIKSGAESSFAKEINENITTLIGKWDSVIKKEAVNHRDNVKNVLTKYNQVSNGLKDFSTWLSSTEQKANTDLTSIQVPSDLSKMKGRFQSLNESVEKKRKDFNSLMKQANELTSSHQGDGIEELQNKVTEIGSKWAEINETVSKKYKFLQDANHQYGEFRALVAQEMDWLDKLEKRLKKSPKTAADAEEISEELDDLENYIRNHPDVRLSRLQELGRALINEKMMSQSVKADVEAITARWSQLSQQSQVVLLEDVVGKAMARDRTVLLEGSVAEAQHLEGQIVLFQEWLGDVEAQLTARIDNDLTAHDLPDDVQRLVEEFETQARTLQQMEEQVRSYRAAGKHEAAARLQEQMVLLQERFSDIAEKFERFRSPSNLEPRLNRAMRELRGIEEATCLLELASEDPESIQGQLNHCKRFYQTLSEIKSEVESVIKSGRKLVEEKSVPQHYTGRLDALKELYNKLGLQVTEAMSSLSTALELSRALQLDLPALASWAEAVEMELDQVEATPPAHRDIHAEISFVKDTLVECDKWRERKDTVKSNYRAFSTLCDPVYLEVLKDRVSDCVRKWERTRDKLLQAQTQLQGFTKASKSILKPSKPMKTVRIKEPGEHSETSLDGSGESGSYVSDTSKILRTEASCKAKSDEKADVENKKSSPKGQVVEGETHVKSILKNDTTTKVFVTKLEMEIPNHGELSESGSFVLNSDNKRRSVYENVDNNETSHVIIEEPEDEEEEYENDTFHLAKDSALFSQVSRTTIITPQNVTNKVEDNPCKVVEVKAKEIPKATVSSTEHVTTMPEKSDHLEPQTVEIVEIIEDTETEADSSAPDTDPEDRWPSPVTARKTDGSHKQRKTCLAPGEILAKRQKMASDEALRTLRESSSPRVETSGEATEIDDSVFDDSIGDAGRDDKTTALLGAAGDSLQESLDKQNSTQPSFTYNVESAQTPPSTPYEQSDNLASPLCLQMTDKVNRVEQATVKTWEIPRDRVIESSKEVTFRKEVEVSKTYQIIGNFLAAEKEMLGLTIPAVEDNDSFYGSDKETDDAIVFSEDEGHVGFDDDTSSSDNEFQTVSEDVELSPVQTNKIGNTYLTNVSSSKASREDEMEDLRRRLDSKSEESLPEMSLDKEIEEFEEAAQEMLERMDTMLVTVRGINSEADPGRRLEVLERELSCLAPDAATLISRGDGLVLSVHSTQPERAISLRTGAQDRLRAKWAQVMSETEVRKVQAQQAEKLLVGYATLSKNVVKWLSDISSRLERANNDERGIKELAEEISSRKSEIEKLKKMSAELEIQQVEHSGLESVARGWQTVRTNVAHLRKDTAATEKVDVTGSDIVTRANKVRESLTIVLRKLTSPPLTCPDFNNFLTQEPALKNVKEEQARLKPLVESLLAEKISSEEKTEQATRVLDKLQQEWSRFNHSVKKTQSRWIKCREEMDLFNTECNQLSDWLKEMEPLAADKNKHQDIEEHALMKIRLVRSVGMAGEDIADRSDKKSAGEVKAKVDALRQRWNRLLRQIGAHKNKMFGLEEGPPEVQVAAVETKIAEVKTLLCDPVNPSDDTALSIRLGKSAAKEEELNSKLQELSSTNSKDELAVKTIAEAKKVLTYLCDHREQITAKLASLKKLKSQLEHVTSWVNETLTRINISKELPPTEKIRIVDNIMTMVYDREIEVKDLKENFTNLEKECQAVKQPMSSELHSKVMKLLQDWNVLKNRGEAEEQPESAKPSTTAAAAAEAIRTLTTPAKPSPAATKGSYNVSRPARHGRSVEVQTPSSAAAANTPPRLSLLASFDKSILQIRDWLTLEEEMLKQQAVVVGDLDDIHQVLDKQKNVLRELEQKKPQLDELVHTAENLKADSNRQQLHGKGRACNMPTN